MFFPSISICLLFIILHFSAEILPFVYACCLFLVDSSMKIIIFISKSLFDNFNICVISEFLSPVLSMALSLDNGVLLFHASYNFIMFQTSGVERYERQREIVYLAGNSYASFSIRSLVWDDMGDSESL